MNGVRIEIRVPGAPRRVMLAHGYWQRRFGGADDVVGQQLVIGIALALALTRVMSAFLFGVGPMDPSTYGAVSAVLAGLTLVATYLPAHRASRVDPAVALRAEA